MNNFKASELVLTPDNKTYHLHLRSENIADDVILFGDQARVEMASTLLDSIEFRSQNRELATCTGIYKGKRITLLSTGMGTDNIDIVVNELDIAVNIDLDNRCLKTKRRTLNLIRIGTCGAFQPEIAIGTAVASKYALGFDGMLYFYKDAARIIERKLTELIIVHSDYPSVLPTPYGVKGSDTLFERVVSDDMYRGITGTACGFYGPQGREVVLKLAFPKMNDILEGFEYEGYRFSNLEMETSALYGLSAMLGHNALTICLAIANRATGDFAKEYKAEMKKLIQTILDRL